MSDHVRLLPADPATRRLLDLRRLEAHTAHFGPLPTVPGPMEGRPGPLAEQVGIAGLRGRGGGWFPTARKLHAVVESAGAKGAIARGNKPVVIANAMEGEHLSNKDKVLITHAPHLVLDGIQAAATTIGATSAFIAVHRGSPLVSILDLAIAERARIDSVRVEVITPPERYVASEETALAHWATDGVAVPVYGARPFQKGMNGRPTLVDNAETLAHLALITRHGGAWFASIGDPQAPGTTLVTVAGAVTHTGVIEVATGTPVVDILARCGGAAIGVRGFLTGGYGGAWARTDDVLAAQWTPDSMAAHGAVIGAGILWALEPDSCPLRELARIAAYMAGESAGQCGPCRFGLPSVADDLSLLATAHVGPEDTHRLHERLALIVGRGGCKHPDGTARLISTGLHAFQDEVAHHLNGRCSARTTAPSIPLPTGRSIPVARAGKDFK